MTPEEIDDLVDGLTWPGEFEILLHSGPADEDALRDLGGPGSGNFGHAGRPGQVGGSAKRGRGGRLKITEGDEASFEIQASIAAKRTEPIANPVHVLGFEVNKPRDFRLERPAQNYVKAYGQEFTSQKRPKGVEQGMPNECYKNASLLVLEREDLTYAEGFAMKEPGGLAIWHAWAVDANDKVVDPTLEDSESWHYFGVKYDRERYLDHLYKAKFYGVIGSTDKEAWKAIKTSGRDLRADDNLTTLGGPGSGNFGHAGRPGQVGGSAPAETRSHALIAENRSRVDEYLGRTHERFATTPEERERLTATLKAAMSGPHVRVAVRMPHEVVDDVLRDGRVKNQFETGQSQGFIDPDALNNEGYVRRQIEKIVSSVDPSLPAADRPIYGAVQGVLASDQLSSYGDVDLEVDPNVHARTTFTFGDSFAFSDERHPTGLAEPLNQPTWRAMTPATRRYLLDDTLLRELKEITPATARGVLRYPRVSYIEAQIHGGLKLSDVKRIVALSGNAQLALTKTLTQAGWRLTNPSSERYPPHNYKFVWERQS